jgi:hypothetical protein
MRGVRTRRPKVWESQTFGLKIPYQNNHTRIWQAGFASALRRGWLIFLNFPQFVLAEFWKLSKMFLHTSKEEGFC